MSKALARATDLSDLRKNLKLDMATFALDMIGIVDPTGAADVASGFLSLWRGDWLGAGISFLGVFAGLGDLAKLGKLGKYAKSLEKVVELARKDPGFAKEVLPHLKELKGVFSRLPMDKLPNDIRPMVQRIRYQLDNFVKEVPPAKGIVKASREVVERCTSLEQARNKAIKWLEAQGAVFGPHTQPIVGKLYQKHTGKRVGVGMTSSKGDVWEIRIDFDPDKGPHYNAKFRAANAPKGTEQRYAFTFPTNGVYDPEAWLKKLMEKLGDTSKRPI